MVLTQEENSIRSLQRYNNNRDEINEKQKKYFRDVWYQNNRQKCLLYQRLIREGKKAIKYNSLDIKHHKPDMIIERNSTVTFN